MRNRLVLVAAGLAIFATVASAQAPKGDEIALRWKPKIGEIHLYHVEVKFDTGDSAIQFKSELKVKVMGVGADGGYSVQTSTTGAIVQSADGVKTLPAQPPQMQFYTKNGIPTGASLGNRDPDPFSDLLDHLTEFQSPPGNVKVKDSWMNKVAGPKTGIFGQPRLTYTLVDIFRDGARHLAKVRYQAAIGMDAEAATGTLILDRVNNSLSQLDANIPHFKPEGASDETAISISLKEKVVG